jgi:hypothetical protein
MVSTLIPAAQTSLIHGTPSLNCLIRFLAGGIREHQWAPYIQEVLRILKPGSGYAQFIEIYYPLCFCEDGTLSPEAPLNKVTPRMFLIVVI